MAIESKIQWTEATWNPWHGCKKVSAGCKYCYMYRDKERYKKNPEIVLRSKGNFNAPLKWHEGKLIFTCSWSDWFIQEADSWRAEAWEIIKKTPQHTYQILTKRPERIKECLPADWGNGYENVWLGVSVENQDLAEERIPLLVDVPAKVRFLSIEPILSSIALEQSYLKHIHWVIVGGESGNTIGKYRYRASYLDWYSQIIMVCNAYRVPVFVKQLGTYLAKEFRLKDIHGGNIDEFPSFLRIREMPAIYQNPELLTSKN